jgi:hypothetical protein
LAGMRGGVRVGCGGGDRRFPAGRSGKVGHGGCNPPPRFRRERQAPAWRVSGYSPSWGSAFPGWAWRMQSAATLTGAVHWHSANEKQAGSPLHRGVSRLRHPTLPLSNIPLSLFLCVLLRVLCASAFHFMGLTLARDRLEARFPRQAGSLSYGATSCLVLHA